MGKRKEKKKIIITGKDKSACGSHESVESSGGWGSTAIVGLQEEGESNRQSG